MKDEPNTQRLARIRMSCPPNTALRCVKVVMMMHDELRPTTFDEVFDDSDPIGWRARYVLGGDVYGRSDSVGEICI